MKTIVQLKNPPKIKIGSVLKAKCLHYLERYKDLGHTDYGKCIPLSKNEMVTLIGVEQHPNWENCFALKFIYDNQILWLAVYKDQYNSILQEEFELVI